MPYYTRNIVILSSTIFLTAFSWNQVVPFLPLFLKQLGAGENVVGWSYGIFVCQAVSGIIAQPLWGKVGDTVGRKPMVLRAGFALVGIYFGMSLCTAPYQVAIFRFLNGALTGFIPGSYALIATNTPKEVAPGYVATAQIASAAGLIMGPPIGWILAGTMGVRVSMQVSGAAVLFSTLLVWWLVREPNKTVPEEKTSLIQDAVAAARSRVLGSVMFAVMATSLFGSAINPVLALHLGNLRGTGPDWLPGAVFSLPAVGLVLFAHRWNRLGAKWGYSRVVVLGMAGAGAGALALGLVHDIRVFAGFYFAAGVFLAAIPPATGAIICTDVEESFRGRAYGMQQAASTLGALIAFLVSLYVGTVFGIRAVFFFVAAVVTVASPVFYVIAYGKRTRPRQNR